MGAKWCDSQPVLIVKTLGNAINMNEKYSNLQIPNYQQISEIMPDDWVELTSQGDRFWVTVDIVNIAEHSCEFIGYVQGALNFPQTFKQGDCIIFEGKNILDVYSREWKNEARISPHDTR